MADCAGRGSCSFYPSVVFLLSSLFFFVVLFVPLLIPSLTSVVNLSSLSVCHGRSSMATPLLSSSILSLYLSLLSSLSSPLHHQLNELLFGLSTPSAWRVTVEQCVGVMIDAVL